MSYFSWIIFPFCYKNNSCTHCVTNHLVFISSTGNQCGINHSESSARQRWQSVSRLAPDGAPRSHSEFELRSALEESIMRRTELIQRLREANSCLDTQTDLLKAKESQLQHSQSTTQHLERKQKVGLFLD